MKKILSAIILISIAVLAAGCPEGIDGDSITVYFLNRSDSAVIESFQYSTGPGMWSSNMVPSGKTLGPGKYLIFDIIVNGSSDIPYKVTAGSQTFASTEYIPLEIWYRGYTPYCSVTLGNEPLEVTASEQSVTEFWADVDESGDLIQ